MTLSERARTILSLTKELEEYVAQYEKAKKDAGYKPWFGHIYGGVEINRCNNSTSLQNRIKLIRAELLQLSQGL